jgi:Xaa-Pro aminopeptidase
LDAIKKTFQKPLPFVVFGSDFAEADTPPAGRLRQDPWFEWTSGCHEPQALILVEPGRTTLFLEPGDPKRVVWDGARIQAGPSAARLFGVDSCKPAKDALAALAQSAKRFGGVALLWKSKSQDPQTQKSKQWRSKLRGLTIHNAWDALADQRALKEPQEIACLRQAISCTAQALKRVLPLIPKLQSESQVAAELVRDYTFEEGGHLAFAPIVGSGIHAATLHYTVNAGSLDHEDCLLIDSGATYKGYCADITRTIPPGGVFRSGEFLELYELVLAAAALGRQHARPGITLKELNEIAWKPILDAGLIRHHGLSHFIGLDVHDVGDRKKPLQAGMVISNEPGIYLPEKGLGIRIEDDLLITRSGCEELSAAIPKEPAKLSEWLCKS